MYNGFIQTTQFTKSEFSPEINSDHAEVRCIANGIRVASLNISNRYHHHYYSIDNNGPFANTHMATDTEWLKTKHMQQIANIKTGFENKTVDVWVLQEAYIEFIHDCRGALDATYTFYYKELTPNDLANSKRNITIIIVNTNVLTILDYKTLQQDRVIVPLIKVCIGKESPIAIAGLHIPGNEEQYPKVGLENLFNMLCGTGEDQILAIGDTNTTPGNITTTISAHEAAKNRFIVVAPLYPTHINPYNQVASYDNIIYSKDMSVQQLGYDAISPDSVALVKCLLDKIL